MTWLKRTNRTNRTTSCSHTTERCTSRSCRRQHTAAMRVLLFRGAAAVQRSTLLDEVLQGHARPSIGLVRPQRQNVLGASYRFVQVVFKAAAD